jgi:hypothetical protein
MTEDGRQRSDDRVQRIDDSVQKSDINHVGFLPKVDQVSDQEYCKKEFYKNGQ